MTNSFIRVTGNVKKVVTSNPQLVDFKENKSSGDAFLIATTMKYGYTVITEENKTKQKKIPFVWDNETIDDEATFVDLTKHFLASLDDEIDRYIVIFKLKGKTQSEIAETLSFTQGAIAKRLKKIKAKFDALTNENK